MAVWNSTAPPGRTRRLCLLAIRLVVCLLSGALIAADVAVQQLSLLTVVAIILGIEHRGVANSILNKGAALRHFLRDDY